MWACEKTSNSVCKSSFTLESDQVPTVACNSYLAPTCREIFNVTKQNALTNRQNSVFDDLGKSQQLAAVTYFFHPEAVYIPP